MRRSVLAALAFWLLACGSTQDDTGRDVAHDLAADTSPEVPQPEVAEARCGAFEVITPSGQVFLNGRPLGELTPVTLGAAELTVGTHVLAVGASAGQVGWYEREVERVEGGPLCQVFMDASDLQQPVVWRALYVDVPDVMGLENGCDVHATQAELDAVYSLFVDNLGRASDNVYEAISWEVTRVTAPETVVIGGGAGDYTLQPSALVGIWEQLQVGEYDAVFTGWKAEGQGCVLDAWYVGLGWTPQADTKMMGFANLRMQAPDLEAHVASLLANDPGGFLHEWLHTVEFFYADRGVPMPEPAGGFPLHAAEVYGYAFPWLDWYTDFMQGHVAAADGGLLGLTPAALRACTLAQAATVGCDGEDTL